MWARIPIMFFSLLMFAVVAYGIASFATWQWHPALWSELLRAAVAIFVIAGWIWDARR